MNTAFKCAYSFNSAIYPQGIPPNRNREVQKSYTHGTSKQQKVTDAQSFPTLCDPVDCSPPGSYVCGILQAIILGWFALPFSKGSSQPMDWTLVPCIAGIFFTIWTTRETIEYYINFKIQIYSQTKIAIYLSTIKDCYNSMLFVITFK